MKELRTKTSVQDLAKKTIIAQSEALTKIATFIDDSFAEAVELIYSSKGRVVISGVGKSAIIANKIVATLNSTGTPSIFMHAADAIHGDLGLVQKEDVIICISKSGNTPEIKVLVPLLKLAENTLIAITGAPDSYLGNHADYIFNSHVDKEVCPNNLAPTTSTTAQLVIGDALAVCLLEIRKFTKDDFAKFHPGGILGKKLFLTIKEISDLNEKPLVSPNSSVKDVIVEISKKRLGVTAVVENGAILGIITDGDLRRMLSDTNDFSNLSAADIMSENPKTMDCNALAADARTLMETHEISQLLVLKDNKYSGVIHIHDLIKEGII